LLLVATEAYIAVRADKENLRGTTSIVTWPGDIHLDVPLVVKTRTFRLYRMVAHRAPASNNLTTKATGWRGCASPSCCSLPIHKKKTGHPGGVGNGQPGRCWQRAARKKTLLARGSFPGRLRPFK
jgi:hypothetical protein